MCHTHPSLHRGLVLEYERVSDQSVEPRPDQQNDPPEQARSIGYLLQAVMLVGVIALTAVITLWVSRDSEKSGIEIIIPDSPPVTFQVSGEVVRPGVYSLEGEPRVDDAINAAGGLTPDADDRQLNLALHVRDGAKVVIPALGSTSDPAAGLQGDSPTAPDEISTSEPTPTNSAVLPGLLDLNSATKDQLIDLPGVGEVRADSIIEWRTNNLISSASDLLAISGIGPSTVDAIRDHVIQP